MIPRYKVWAIRENGTHYIVKRPTTLASALRVVAFLQQQGIGAYHTAHRGV